VTSPHEPLCRNTDTRWVYRDMPDRDMPGMICPAMVGRCADRLPAYLDSSLSSRSIGASTSSKERPRFTTLPPVPRT
jgi:hypothetical protein